MNTARRRAQVIYAVCVLAVVAGLAAISWHTLRLESRERAARAESSLQEAIRLALWRMDSAVAPVIAAEARRPYFEYKPFYPADRAYTRMYEEVKPGEVLVPSPLLSDPGPYVRLHFQIDPDQRISSPQVPSGLDRQQAEESYVAPARLAAAEAALRDLDRVLRGEEIGGVALDQLAAEGRDADRHAQRIYDPAAVTRSEQEFIARQEQARNLARGNIQSPFPPAPERALEKSEPDQPAPSDAAAYARRRDMDSLGVTYRSDISGREIRQGPLEPIWRTGPPGMGPQLLLVRSVFIDSAETVQGVWLDWPALSEFLLDQARALLPAAELRPVYPDSAPRAELLATIPALLVPGELTVAPLPALTPTRIAIILAWGAVLAAVVAIGAVLRKSTDLAERRGQFVSAVTHELRTPLTTFCLYTQMLADGMIKGESTQGEYLGTLKRESQRLARIVENVLEYARLGQRTRPLRRTAIPAEELIARIAPSLSAHADQADMDLVIDRAGAAGAVVQADPQTVERILTNLVENSGKYAAAADDRRLHLHLARQNGALEIRYRDHGPGIPRGEEPGIFQPFRRGRRDAEGPAPGLGLGLALARGLARELGGDLRLVHEVNEGAEFLLTLPTAQGSPR